MADVIDLTEQFRKIKRALMTFSAIAILFGAASIGPEFKPEVLGHEVTIASWEIALGLVAYVIYLWIGFEHEQRRAKAQYLAATYDPDPEQRTPEAALDRLLVPFDNFGGKFQGLADELDLVERTFHQLGQPFDLETANPSLSSVSYATMQINQADATIGILMRDAASKSETVELSQVRTALSELMNALKRIPEIIRSDCARLLEPAAEAGTQRRLQADAAIDRLANIAERIDQLRGELGVANADIKKLSAQLSSRERWMFSYYDTWAPRVLAASAILFAGRHIASALVAHWPIIAWCEFV